MCRQQAAASRLPHLLVVVLGARHLVVVDGQPRDLGAAGGGDGAHRAAHPAANVQRPLAPLQFA